MDSEFSRLIKLIFNKNSKDYAENGGLFISDTATHTGNYGPIFVVTDCVFSSSHVSNILGLNDGTTTYTAGSIIYGIHTAVDLVSGSVIAYKRV